MMNDREQGLKTHPWDNCGFINGYTFSWTVPMIRLAWGKELEEDDLDDCPKFDQSDILGDKLDWKSELHVKPNWEWQKELQKRKEQKNYKASLRSAVQRAFGKAYLFQCFLVLILDCGIRTLQPVFLGWLIRYFSQPGSLTAFESNWAAAGVGLVSFLAATLYHPILFSSLVTGMRLRIAACTLIYRKSMKLSQRSMGKTTIGQMVNLLSNDVNRFDMAVAYLPFLIVGPVQTVVVIAILWQHLGPSCLFGLIVLLLFIPFQSYMGKIFSKLRSKTAILTDERVRLMNEIVEGIRVIKMYTCELPFSKLVGSARRQEVDKIRRSSILKGFINALFFSASKLIVFVSFVGYILLGNSLSAEIVFVSISLYNNIRFTMTLFFPMAITSLAESTISLKRIQDFLELEEQSPKSVLGKIDQEVDQQECGIWLNSVSAKWSEDSDKMNLSNVSMNVEAGELLAVVGSVGSGKSSLLLSILGELPLLSGDVNIRGRVSYSPQEAWVFSGSLQQNILFGLPMENSRYKQVLEVCALTRDIELLPYGDETLVGERGVSLSGGQKARVTLARSIYRDANVYLIDDPLSAVDVSVAKHLFEECINGFIKDKPRILVTHQVQFLRKASRIIIIENGTIITQGSYDDLVAQGYDLLSFADDQNTKTVNSSNLQNDDFDSNLTPENADTISDYLPTKEPPESVEAPKQRMEDKTEGSLKASTYLNYLVAGGGAITIGLVFFANLLTQLIYSYSDYWLSLWSSASENNGTTENTNTWDAITSISSDQNTNIYIYTGLIVGLFLLSLMRTVGLYLICMNSSMNLHNNMFKSVARAPVSFFDKNPVGRILNRFTKDMGLIDDVLPFTYVDFISNLLSLLGLVILVTYISPLIAVPTVILFIVFVFVRRFYIRAARDLKRLEGTTRSPVFSHLSTSLYGITTIRSFGVQKEFEKDFCSFQDSHTSAFFTQLCSSKWFALVLDQLTVLYIVFLIIFLLTVDYGGITGSNIGLALSSAILLSGAFQWTVRQYTDLETQMTAIERVLEYSNLKPEAELESLPNRKPPKDWPKDGAITMKDLCLTYKDSSDLPVLKNLNCDIKGGEKIGIVGRTGAGKSSIVAAIFRMAEPNGSLTIDSLEIKNIGLHDLRNKVSIIPQDPILFSGPVRRNLDPFDQYKDEDLWAVLEEVQLKDVIMESSGGLDKHIAEAGSNFSVGQRQLICLARALLRKNKILVLDEATANVDHITDALIQNTIRKMFSNCTVITVAHRLNTIMDSDRIMVLDNGEIVEFDRPLALLNNEDSLLSKMVKQTGAGMIKKLYKIAENAQANNQSEVKKPN